MDCFAALAMTRRASWLSRLRQPPHHLVELLEVAVADLHGAAGIAVIDGDGEAERVADALFQRERVGVLGLAAAAARLLRLALRHALVMRQRLGLAHVEAFLDDALGRGERIGHADQRAGMAGGQLAGGDIGLHLGRQLGQPHHVGDMAAALADDLGDVVLAAFEFVGERVIALRLFHRVEVFALHVLDDRDLERVAVADIDRDDRHFVQAGELRGAPAAFAGDDLEAVLRALHRPHHDRLDHAVLLDRSRRARRVRHRKRSRRGLRGLGFRNSIGTLRCAARPLDMRGLAADIADQTCKTAAQSRTRFVGHRQLPWIHAHHSGIRISVDPSFGCAQSEAVTHRLLRQRDHDGHRLRRYCPPYVARQCARSSRSRWITSVASFR